MLLNRRKDRDSKRPRIKGGARYESGACNAQELIAKLEPKANRKTMDLEKGSLSPFRDISC